MLYTFEDALQIYHAKSSTIEVFEPVDPGKDWQGITETSVRRTEDYFSDDIIIDFDLFDRATYEEKLCGGKPSVLINEAFPVLVIVRAARV